MFYKIKIENESELLLSINDIINLIKKNPELTYYKNINDKFIKINNNIVLNTIFICHRINTILELNSIESQFGTEIDIRDDNISKKLILSHDPYDNGDYFEDYLKNYKNNILILNIKSERVEIECNKLLEKYNIREYFYLDSSFPMIYLLNTKYKNNNIASRLSEYEPYENTECIKNYIKWIWIDCFTYLPLDKEIFEKIKKINKSICIVSPELQGQQEKIEEFREMLIINETIPNAICCKKYNIIRWI